MFVQNDDISTQFSPFFVIQMCVPLRPLPLSHNGLDLATFLEMFLDWTPGSTDWASFHQCSAVGCSMGSSDIALCDHTATGKNYVAMKQMNPGLVTLNTTKIRVP